MEKLFRFNGQVLLGVVAVVAVGAIGRPASAQPIRDNCPEVNEPLKKNMKKVSWQMPPEVATAQNNLKLVAADTRSQLAGALISSAKGDCSKVKDGLFNGNVQMCLAYSAQLLAQVAPNPTASQEAVSAYCTAAKLADAANDANRRADAWDGMARTFAAWPNHVNEEYSAWAEASKAKTAYRLWKRAQAEVRVLNYNAADATYSELGTITPGLSPTEKATALREQAHLRRDNMKRPAADIAFLWQNVVDSSADLPTKSEAYFELAMLDFASNAAKAVTNFNFAIRPPSATRDIDAPNVLESYYRLAVINARTAKTSAEWKTVLDQANHAGLGQLAYRQLACLAYIAVGSDESLAGTMEATVCPDGSTAEDKLLRGVFLLRRAQFSPYLPCPEKMTADTCTATIRNPAVFENLQKAKVAFGAGERLALERPPTPGGGAAVFDWLLLGPAASPKLFGVLKSGEDITEGFRQKPACTVRRPEEELEAKFFEQLDLLTCAPSPTRRTK